MRWRWPESDVDAQWAAAAVRAGCLTGLAALALVALVVMAL